MKKLIWNEEKPLKYVLHLCNSLYFNNSILARIGDKRSVVEKSVSINLFWLLDWRTDDLIFNHSSQNKSALEQDAESDLHSYQCIEVASPDEQFALLHGSLFHLCMYL